MEYFIQQLINGVTLGSIYGLIAIGYTMVYGIIGMINFAHGDIFMISAFIALIGLLVLFGAGITWLPLVLIVVLILSMSLRQPGVGLLKELLIAHSEALSVWPR